MSTPTPPPVPPAIPAPSNSDGPKQTSGMAVAALILGIISIIGGAMFILPTILAIVLGHVALAKCNKNPSLSGKGMAIAGFALGYASFLFVGLMAAITIPAFNKVRENAEQKTMEMNARLIGSAAQQYMLDNAAREVTFQIDPETGAVTGPLSSYSVKVSKLIHAVDNKIEMGGSFSLQSAHAFKGTVVEFNDEGRMK